MRNILHIEPIDICAKLFLLMSGHRSWYKPLKSNDAKEKVTCVAMDTEQR